jgi:hypothetical protein
MWWEHWLWLRKSVSSRAQPRPGNVLKRTPAAPAQPSLPPGVLLPRPHSPPAARVCRLPSARPQPEMQGHFRLLQKIIFLLGWQLGSDSWEARLQSAEGCLWKSFALTLLPIFWDSLLCRAHNALPSSASGCSKTKNDSWTNFFF